MNSSQQGVVDTQQLVGQRRMCRRCVLSENPPDLWLDESGVCNVCQDFESKKRETSSLPALETEFVRILNQHKSKGKYDCLVMCSGGKDSTAALYYMKKRYKRNLLAFTFDHGFETPDALENVQRAVDVLGVDHLMFKSDFMKDMFVEIVKTNSKAVLCHPCSIWYMSLTFDLAAQFDIPIIIAGWTKGQAIREPLNISYGCDANQQEFLAMSKATQDFLSGYISKNSKYKNFPKKMADVVKRASQKHKSLVLSPHWFLPSSTEAYVEILQKELGWKYPAESYPAKTTNCYLNFISVCNSMRNFGYTHYHVEMSKMIRDGLLLREDALKALDVRFDRELLQRVAQKLGCHYEI